MELSKREKVYKSGNGVCYLCNLPVTFNEFTIDHYVPRSMGGTNHLDNLRPTHSICNRKRASGMDFYQWLFYIEKYKDKFSIRINPFRYWELPIK